jgi:hypothetical protein
MSQPSSSIDPFAPPELTEEQMLTSVEEYCAADAPPTPLRLLVEFFGDPFSRTDSYRPDPLWVSLAVFFMLGLGTFLYFSFSSH